MFYILWGKKTGRQQETTNFTCFQKTYWLVDKLCHFFHAELKERKTKLVKT